MRWRPEAPSIYLPTSGQIDLNAIGVEAGQANNSQTTLNDAAVRDMIGKASGAQNAMSEYYGASSSDAVDSESFGSDWQMALRGKANASVQCSNRLSGDPLGYPHKWPLTTADGQPRPLISPYLPQVAYNGVTENLGSHFPCWGSKSSVTQFANQPRMSFGNWSDNGSPNTMRGIVPMQRIKPGSHTFSGLYKAVSSGHDGSAYSIEVNILEYETMTPGGDGFATAGGAYRRQTLAANSATLIGTIPQTNFNATITTIYEWLFLELKGTNKHDRGVTSSGQINSIS